MKAALLRTLTGPDGLSVVDVDPPAARDSVLIEVRAAGVNYPDLLVTRGQYQGKFEAPLIPGAEVAGTVVTAPPESGFQPGDRVAALSGVGGYAEQVAVPAALVLPAPAGLSFAEAVALVANHQTAYFALKLRARWEPGQTVAVLGSAGGLGSAAVQVAHGLGASVIALVHRDGADDFVRSVGADHVVGLRDGWAQAVRDLTGGRGVDIVIDPVGGEAFDNAVRILAPDGRVVVVGFAGGDIPSVAVNRLLLRNVDVVGAGWGEYLRTHPSALGRVGQGLGDLVAAGLRPPVTKTFALDEAADALRLLESGGVLGKVVLIP